MRSIPKPPKNCLADGCRGAAHSKGLCIECYSRARHAAKTQRPSELGRLAERARRDRLTSGALTPVRVARPDAKARAVVSLYRKERRNAEKRHARIVAAAKREFDAMIAREQEERGRQGGRSRIQVGRGRGQHRPKPVDALLLALQPFAGLAPVDERGERAR